jgi:hypothetical protein
MRSSQLNTAVALAERHVLMQRVLIYPPSVRREVIRQSLHGGREEWIAADLQMPLTDVRAIMQAFSEITERPRAPQG